MRNERIAAGFSHIRARLGWIIRAMETNLTQVWMKGIRLVLSLLILTILTALTGGVIKTFLFLARQRGSGIIRPTLANPDRRSLQFRAGSGASSTQ